MLWGPHREQRIGIGSSFQPLSYVLHFAARDGRDPACRQHDAVFVACRRRPFTHLSREVLEWGGEVFRCEGRASPNDAPGSWPRTSGLRAGATAWQGQSRIPFHLPWGPASGQPPLSEVLTLPPACRAESRRAVLVLMGECPILPFQRPISVTSQDSTPENHHS